MTFVFSKLFVGIDIGTSGVRVAIIDENNRQIATAKQMFSPIHGRQRDPNIWWQTASTTLKMALAQTDKRRVCALAVDGTSGSLVAVNDSGKPLTNGSLYNECCMDAKILSRIKKYTPPDSVVHSSSNPLARAIALQHHKPFKLLHQADWISWHFSGRFISDANNAMKTGYDAVIENWPSWIADTGMNPILLPRVVMPATIISTINSTASTIFGLDKNTQIIAGTTDGCAAYLATGARGSGDGVTSLGTTLVIKILSQNPIFAPTYGIYSHKIMGMWLAGGASNSGGGAVLKYFTAEEINHLSKIIDWKKPTNLTYYPLPKPGERFPINDPEFKGLITPKPPDRSTYLQAFFEGIADIEINAYKRLAKLGALAVKSVRTVGGGASNIAWNNIRAQKLHSALNAKLLPPIANEAAFGAAFLAKTGYQI